MLPQNVRLRHFGNLTAFSDIVFNDQRFQPLNMPSYRILPDPLDFVCNPRPAVRVILAHSLTAKMQVWSVMEKPFHEEQRSYFRMGALLEELGRSLLKKPMKLC